MKNLKKIFLVNILIFFTIFFLLDFILSKTFFNPKKNSCYNVEKFFYSLKKNCIGEDKFKSSFPTVKIYTDNQGLRIGKFTDRNNHQKKEKIFLFGDSFVFGVGLEYEQTIAGILESYFKSYDFYNFAVGSYSPTVHLFNLEKQISMKNLPKKIILFLDMTDIHDEAARWKIIDGKPTLPDTQVYDNFNKKKKFLQNNFIVTRSFFHFLNNKIRILRSKIKNNDDVKTSLQAGFTYREILELQGHYKDDIFNIGLNNIKEKITNISNISKKINSEFYLVIYPYAETLVFGQKKFSWEDFGYDLCKKNNCKLVNTFDEFRSYKIKNSNWYSDLYFIGDEHFNAGGNKLLSNELIKKIFIK